MPEDEVIKLKSLDQLERHPTIWKDKQSKEIHNFVKQNLEPLLTDLPKEKDEYNREYDRGKLKKIRKKKVSNQKLDFQRALKRKLKSAAE
jgi:hypothetical protein